MTPEQTAKIRKARAEAFESGKRLTNEEAVAQMRRNGSVPSPNPWYRGPQKDDDEIRADGDQNSERR